MVLYQARISTLIAWAFRSKVVLFTCASLLILFTFFYSPIRATSEEHIGISPDAVAEAIELPLSTSQEPSLERVNSKYAFATFLAGQADDADERSRSINDQYFIATRILAYQFLHATETRSRDRSIPFIVLVTDNVNEERRARLRRDGAIIVPAELITSSWVKTETSTWQDVMTKLRLWKLTQFERICFVDGDTVLAQPIDGVFQDDAVSLRKTGDNQAEIFDDEDEMPANYTFAGVPEMNRTHGFPPDHPTDYPNWDYLNAGFFVFEPSLKMFDYYMSLMNTVNKFDPQMPEQNLLNYAHRHDGNMPWLHLNNTWNIHYPTKNDVEGGVKSVHDKWWAPESSEMKPWLERWRWQMEGYYEARDALMDDPASIMRLQNP